MSEARRRKLSGVSLKDEAEAPRQLASPPARTSCSKKIEIKVGAMFRWQ